MRAAKTLRLTALAGLVVLAGLLLTATAASAQQAPSAEPALMKLNDVASGSLLIRTASPGHYITAPMVATDVKIDVTGTIARVSVTQRFENPSSAWVEAVYAFPLPDNAAVDRLRLRIGDRFIEGKIKEREEARQIYEEAKASGKKASIVEQQRPNLFTNEVANIGPGEVVVVQIEYQEAIRVTDGAFHLRFPMVSGPRYNPPARMASVTVDGKTHHVLADPVPDRNKLPGEGSYAHPSEGRVNPLTLSVDLKTGFPLASVDTPFHRTTLKDEGDGRMTLTLADGSVPANRDFELTWRAKTGAAPDIALFKEKVGDDEYLLLNVMPPETAPKAAPSRELVLVIDVSGSMSGASIHQAKAAALDALGCLRNGDRVNVIAFNDGMSMAFSAPVPATPGNLAAARAYVSGLSAGGGTEMLPALIAALDSDDAESDLLRQIVFMTDGAVGNEEELFRAIDSLLGQSRLFTVGIGSAPNSFFMTRAATMGRGTFTYIGNPNQVRDRMAALFRKLEHPVLTNIEIDWPKDIAADVWPDIVPDLYHGEPIVISARSNDLGDAVRVRGILDGKPWQTTVDFNDAETGQGVAALWARHKIAGLEEARYRGADFEETRAQITAVALEHHLVSAHTSLVAVDVTPARPADEDVYRKDVPLMLPEGWEWEGVFREPGRLTPLPARADEYAALIAPNGTAEMLALPRGATPAMLNVLLGLLALAIGLLVVRYRSPTSRHSRTANTAFPCGKG